MKIKENINFKKKRKQMKKKKEDKVLQNYILCSHWLYLAVCGRTVAKWIADRGYHIVAIYGLGETGQILYEALKNTDLEILYGIDKNKSRKHHVMEVYTLNDNLPNVDLVIITLFTEYERIKEKLDLKISCPVISIQHIIDEMYDDFII